MTPDLIAETRAKHRDRALQAIAEHRCATDLTNGFCTPHGGKCQRKGTRDCCREAAGILAAIESRGMSVIWSYDKRIAVMPLYMCTRCGSVENTALGEYWRQEIEAHENGKPLEPKCSACIEGGAWHGQFERRRADGYVSDAAGRYIYSKAEVEAGSFAHMGPFKELVLPAEEKTL
ncbi:MAG: hypothetical protein IT537_03080 [Hyphomicrobiales bacterium]|nr:hypothetical protein [Hyphomicrobiales bacterium]